MKNYVTAGGVPFPINDTLIKIFKTLLTVEQAKFLLGFRKRSLNINQIKAKTDLDDKALDRMLNNLMDDGLIIGLPSRSTGIMVYYLIPILPGLFEYPFMKGEKGEKQKKLSILLNKLIDEFGQLTQSNYDELVKQFMKGNPLDRVVPVKKEVEIHQDVVLPYEDIKHIIANHDIISVNHCYCRNWKENLGDPCKLDAPNLNCLSFGRTARFLIDHNFGKQISNEEAIKILEEAEDIGLVHKAFHVQQNPEQEIQTLCNCCNCCCQIFEFYKRGSAPFRTFTSYIANVDVDKCKGCGTCVEKCPIEAIEIVDTLSVTNTDKCLGCGVCAHHCPENARTLERTGLREVFIPPPKIAEHDLKLIQT